MESEVNDRIELEKMDIKQYFKELSPTYIPPDIEMPYYKNIDLNNLPDSYKTNTNLELKCLAHVKIFNKQYKEIYPSRKKLLLIPKNEVGCKKFICTYIRPVIIPYPEFNTWHGAASFVADHLNYDPLIPLTEVPDIIYSSTSILKLEEGHCFDYSILLCSMLIGVGYDAYVVSGYASRECCYKDQRRDICPYFDIKKLELPKIPETPAKKYIVKPPKTLQSNYELIQIAHEIRKKQDEEELLKEKEKADRIAAEKPKPDPLYGARVHAWIYVKAGCRDITEDFFIEPFTGVKYDVRNSMFLGIESLFNDKNYWINKYCCIDALRTIEFELDNLSYWEPIFVEDSEFDFKYQYEPDLKLKIPINVPLSFVKYITIDKYTYERRYPNKQKFSKYNRVKQWNYSPYFCLSGLIARYRVYDDFEYENLIETHEFLEKREDRHYKTIIKGDKVSQYFHPGNEYHLKEYHFEKSNPGPENNRKILFYENVRVDGLVERIETTDSMKEIYKNRPDKLESMFVKFTPRDRDDDFSESYRFIECIVKKYQRNYSKPIDDDIEEIQYLLNENEIHILYHAGDFNMIQSNRKFVKPPPPPDGRNVIIMQPDTHVCFRADPYSRQKTELEIYELLRELVNDEKKTIDLVRHCEADSRNIIKARTRAIREDFLYLDLFDTIRNEEAKLKRMELEQEYLSMLNKQEEELDFLQPYLSQYHLNGIDNKEQAFMIREACLNDLKFRLIKQANLIKDRFEFETDQLQKQQTWYYQNKMILTLEDEQKYLEYCANSISLLDSLESLLSKHKQTAPHKYVQIERKIRNDPRMKPFMGKYPKRF